MRKETSRQTSKKSCLTCLLWFCGVAAIVSAVLGLAGWYLMSPNSPKNRSSAIQATCEWARLNPLPVQDEEVNVTTKGSMFTREFIIEFEAPADRILQWLKESPGTSAAFSTSRDKAQDTHLEITPGGGAVFAEITVSQNGRHIRVRAYWS